MNKDYEKILLCPNCGHIWDYTGEAEKGTSCPSCKGYVNIQGWRVDKPLGETGDYGGARFLCVTNEAIIYFDHALGVFVECIGPTNPYSRMVTTEARGITPFKVDREIKDFLKGVHWDMGIRYINPIYR